MSNGLPLMLIADDIMERDLITLRPEWDIFRAIETLLDRRISGAPVVDADGKLVGVLSEKDCLAILANDSYQALAGGVVEEYMTRAVTTIAPTMDIYSISGLFRQNHFRRVPVCDGGRLVGQVSRRDVLVGIRQMRAAHAATPSPFPDYRRPT